MNLMMRGEATSLNAVGPDTAMRLSTVYACIKVLSETVSTLPCHLFKLSDDRATKSHAWGDALHSLVNRSPNDWQTSQEFWQQQMVNLCLRGNSYNYIVRAGSSGRVVAIHPLPVDAVSVNVYAQNRIEYSVTVGEKGEQRSEVFQPDEILHFKTMSMDGIRGVSSHQLPGTFIRWLY